MRGGWIDMTNEEGKQSGPGRQSSLCMAGMIGG